MRNFLARGLGALKSLDVTQSFRLRGTEYFAQYRTPVVVQSVLFTENGAGTYTGTIALPANNRIIDIGVSGEALWTAATSASLIVGDGADDDGFFVATNLKATDLLVGETNNIEHPGGLAGAYIASEQRKLFQATARNVIGVATSVGAGTAGRTRLYVVYTIVDTIDAVKS